MSGHHLCHIPACVLYPHGLQTQQRLRELQPPTHGRCDARVMLGLCTDCIRSRRWLLYWLVSGTVRFVFRGFPSIYEMAVLQNIYRIELNMVHLMLRAVLPEQPRDSRICMLICHVYIAHLKRGAVFDSYFAKFYELEAGRLRKCRK